MSTEPAEAGTDSAGPDAVEVVAEMNRRFLAGDRAGAMALMADDLRIEQADSLPHGGTHLGHAGMAEMGAAFARHWTRQITDPRVFGRGRDVVQITTQAWTSVATGRSATVEVVEVMEVAGGQVRRIRVFPQDTYLLLATLEA